MPEGPEVRLNRDTIAHHIEGHTVKELRVSSKKFEYIDDVQQGKLRLPAQVTEVRVKGKMLLIMLSSGAGITSTLGMSGWWYPHISQLNVADFGEKAYYNGNVLDVSSVISKSMKHIKAELVTDAGIRMVYTDPRNFGNLKLWSAEELAQAHPFNKLGPDLLNEIGPMLGKDPDATVEFMQQVRARATKRQNRMPMGQLCLEQDFLCGLGNIYRAETLYLAGISPHEQLQQLSDDQWLKFVEVAVCVLDIAYQHKGTMHYPLDMLWLLHPEIASAVSEHFKITDHTKNHVLRRHLVYGQKQDPAGNVVVADDSFGRTMWWCPVVQDPA